MRISIVGCVFTNTVFHFRTTTELTTNLSTAIAKTFGIQSHSQIVEIIIRTVRRNSPNSNLNKANKITLQIFFILNLTFNGIVSISPPSFSSHIGIIGRFHSHYSGKDVVSIHHRPRTRQIRNPSLHHEHLHKLPRHRLHGLRHLLRGPAPDVVGRRIAARRRQRHCGP